MLSDNYWKFMEKCWSTAIHERPSIEGVVIMIKDVLESLPEVLFEQATSEVSFYVICLSGLQSVTFSPQFPRRRWYKTSQLISPRTTTPLLPAADSVRYGSASIMQIGDRSMYVCKCCLYLLVKLTPCPGCSKIVASLHFR